MIGLSKESALNMDGCTFYQVCWVRWSGSVAFVVLSCDRIYSSLVRCATQSYCKLQDTLRSTSRTSTASSANPNNRNRLPCKPVFY